MPLTIAHFLIYKCQRAKIRHGKNRRAWNRNLCDKVHYISCFNYLVDLTNASISITPAFMLYYDDPKGSLPTWLINWAAKTGVPKFMSDLQIACKNYKK